MSHLVTAQIASPSAGRRAAIASYPSVCLHNDVLNVSVCLPDARRGFYRGPRFDWSGVLGQVEYAGHTFFAPWKPGPHDPNGHEDALGPAEEFDQSGPMGFDQTPAGESFLKIGVGLLIRPDSTPYRFSRRYALARPGEWAITDGPDWITFTQSLSDGRGLGYRYVKRVSLASGQPALTIDHSLENTGTQILETQWYCHNFLNFDGYPVGPDCHLIFPAPPAYRPKAGQDVLIAGNSLTFARPLQEPQFGRLEAQASPLWVRAEDRHAGAGVMLQLSEPPLKMNLFAAPGAVCPEPFLHLHLTPGRSRSWRTDYKFFALPTE